MKSSTPTLSQRIQTLDAALNRNPVKYLPGFRSGLWWKRLVASAAYVVALATTLVGYLGHRQLITDTGIVALALCLSIPHALTTYAKQRARRPPRATAFTPRNVLFPGGTLAFLPSRMETSWKQFFERASHTSEFVLSVPSHKGRPAQLGTESKVHWTGSVYEVEGLQRVRVLKLRRIEPELYEASYVPLEDEVGPDDGPSAERVARTFIDWAQQRPELSWSYGVLAEPPARAVNTMCQAIFAGRPEESELLGIDDVGQRALRVAQELAKFGYGVPPAPVPEPLAALFMPSISPPPRADGMSKSPKGAVQGSPAPPHPEGKARGQQRLELVEAELEAMVGLEGVKRQVRGIRDRLEFSDQRVKEGLPPLALSHHLIFSGAPGTGKTTVARLYGELLAAMGVLSKGQIVEATRSSLVGEFQGHTAVKTEKIVKQAIGGVLFVDEAYSLKMDERDIFGEEAVDTLVNLMEEHRDDVVLILAGYGDRMRRFLKTNEGLASRFSDTVEFPNYGTSELQAIFELMAARDGYRLPPETTHALYKVLGRLPRGPGFGNARDVRKLYEHTQTRQASRLTGVVGGDLRLLLPEDLVDKEAGAKRDQKRIQSLLSELDDMVGLAAVKQQVKEQLASIDVDQRRRDLGLPVDRAAQHLVFAGAPGTGKTIVARLYGQLLAAMGVLSQGQVVEAARLDLVAGYLGQTGIKTEAVFDSAIGGVLFIDEAYALKNDEHDFFGQEAIDTLVKLMEDHRDEVVVIVAGYTDRMKDFVRTNPGLASRFSGTIEFPNYTTAELQKIFASMAERGGYLLSDTTQSAVFDVLESLPREPDFGNGREVRNLYEKAILRMKLRVNDDRTADLQVILPQDVKGVGSPSSG